MKKITKLVALVLGMVMVLSLCGCGDESKKVVGRWAYEIDMQEMLMEEMGDEFAGFESSLVITLYFDFNEDGTMALSADKEKFVANYDAWLNDFSGFAADMIYEQMEAAGYSKEDVDAAYDGSVQDYFIEVMNQSVSAEDLADEMKNEGVWKAKGGKLYISEGDEVQSNSYDLYEIEGDTMTLNMPEGASDDTLVPGMEYPIVLKKVN